MKQLIILIVMMIFSVTIGAEEKEKFPGFPPAPIGVDEARWKIHARPPSGWIVVKVTTSTKWLEGMCQRRGMVLHKDIVINERGLPCTYDFSEGRKTRFTRNQYLKENEARRICEGIWDGEMIEYQVIVRQIKTDSARKEISKRGIGQEMFICVYKSKKAYIPEMTEENKIESPIR